MEWMLFGNENRIAACLTGWCAIVFFVSNVSQSVAQVDTQSHGHPFLVSFSSPLQLPATLESGNHQFTATEISKAAAARCSKARVLIAESHVQGLSRKKQESDPSERVLRLFQSGIETRIRQTASANALKLHFAIVATLQAESILNHSEELLLRQQQALDALVEKGIPIPDPILVRRLQTTLNDKRMDNQSKQNLARTQLAALVGPELSCSYLPTEDMQIVPSDMDVCDRIKQAITCRCDLVTLRQLRTTIDEDTIEAWDSIGAMMSGLPSPIKKAISLSRILRTHRKKSEVQSTIELRRRWLDELITDRKTTITTEVESAFEKKKAAALRWANSTVQLENWDTRIAQLKKMENVQGNLASQIEAKLNRHQAMAEQLERWLEWQHANTDLKLAIGSDF